jgi:hypothetical protein
MTPAICAEGRDDPRLPRAENDIDDRGSAAANEDRALRELQRLVEDLAPSEAYSPADAPTAAGGSRSDVAGNRPGRADMDASGRPREKPIRCRRRRKRGFRVGSVGPTDPLRRKMGAASLLMNDRQVPYRRCHHRFHSTTSHSRRLGRPIHTKPAPNCPRPASGPRWAAGASKTVCGSKPLWDSA